MLMSAYLTDTIYKTDNCKTEQWQRGNRNNEIQKKKKTEKQNLNTQNKN